MYWNWKLGGCALGLIFLLAVVIVKPIAVSTQYVVVDGIIADIVNPEMVIESSESKSGYYSSNSYLNKSGGYYAKAVANPLNYGFVFVISMIVGGFLGRLFKNMENEKYIDQIPEFHQQKFGNRAMLRYCLAFIGGVLVLIGARLAGGSTSGHMMSGMMHTAISGYIFTCVALIVAIPIARLLYKK